MQVCADEVHARSATVLSRHKHFTNTYSEVYTHSEMNKYTVSTIFLMSDFLLIPDYLVLN